MSRRRDLTETLTNTVGGFFIAWAVAVWVFPLVGVHTNAGTAFSATFVMFCVSNVRAYTLRRIFRWLEHRK